MRSTLLAFGVALVLSGCAQRNATILPAGAVASPSAGTTAPSTISITIPAPQQTSSAARKAAYISTASNSMVLTPQGQPQIVMPLSTTTPGCRTLNGARICTFRISLPTGTYSMRVALYATADGTGTPLALVNTMTTIVANTTNNIDFTLSAVVAALSVALVPDGVFVPGSAASRTINVGAVDAGGATIVVGTDSLVDSNGSAVTIRLANTDTSGATTLSSQNAGPSGNTLSYNGATSSGGTLTATAVNASNVAVTSARTTFTVSSAPVCGAQIASGLSRRPDASSCVVQPPSPIAEPTPFMAFPLACGMSLAANQKCPASVVYDQGAYTPGRINTVLDHSLVIQSYAGWQYGTLTDGDGDGVVTAFNGSSVGNNTAAQVFVDQGIGFVCGTINIFAAGGDLVNQPIPGQEEGQCGLKYASYDEHPGYDYVAGYGSEVKAVADGNYVGYGGEPCIPTGLTPRKGSKTPCKDWGWVGIDHGNGYVSQYGHMDPNSITATPGAWVSGGTRVGLSSNTSPYSLGPHLHFEVLARVINDPSDYYNRKNWAVVDPYGWTAGIFFRPDGDPLYSRWKYGVKPKQLWK